MSKSFFAGGVHPNDSKALSASASIERLPAPEKVYIPLRQHIGAEATATVKAGDLVKKGQLIAESAGFVSANIHASTSGEVVGVVDYQHPTFGNVKSIHIKSDGQDQWMDGLPMSRVWNTMSAEDTMAAISAAGIVGMGGATFPAHVKLSPPKDKVVDTFILNGAECEPYLTSDYRAMLEMSDDIVEGIKIVAKMLNIANVYIGIEDNKKDAVAKMQEAVKGTNFKVVCLPTRYPQGGEKMLIKAITGKELGSGKLPSDLGVIVHNVGTMKAVADAVTKGIPLIERVCTVTGDAMKTPKNVIIKIGTTLQDIIDMCGGFKSEPEKIILGGPMMGFAQANAAAASIKGTGGILALTKNEVNNDKESNCIRCGRCVEACPMGLVPSMLSLLGQKSFYEEAKTDYSLLDCMECGSCVYVCPAKRNIVQYVRYMKNMNAQAAVKK